MKISHGYTIDINGNFLYESVYCRPVPKAIVTCEMKELINNGILVPFEYEMNSNSPKINYHIQKGLEKAEELILCHLETYFPNQIEEVRKIHRLLNKLGLSLITCGFRTENKKLSESDFYYYKLNANGKINPLQTIKIPIKSLIFKDDVLNTDTTSIDNYINYSDIKILSLTICKDSIKHKVLAQFGKEDLVNFLQLLPDCYKTFKKINLTSKDVILVSLKQAQPICLKFYILEQEYKEYKRNVSHQ